MCVLSIKVPIQKKSGNFNLMILVYIREVADERLLAGTVIPSWNKQCLGWSRCGGRIKSIRFVEQFFSFKTFCLKSDEFGDQKYTMSYSCNYFYTTYAGLPCMLSSCYCTNPGKNYGISSLWECLFKFFFISNVFLLKKSFLMHFYCKNHL